MPLDGHFPDLSPLHGSKEVAKGDLILIRSWLVEKVEEQDHHQADHEPESQILIEGAQFSPHALFPFKSIIFLKIPRDFEELIERLYHSGCF
jgi:hypothetical protein